MLDNLCTITMVLLAGIACGIVLAEAREPCKVPKPLGRAPASIPGPEEAPQDKSVPAYDEQGINTTRVPLESKGLEVYRPPANTYTFNVGVHSMFVYSVTQCLPLDKDLEIRFALKHYMSLYRPDSPGDINLSPGQARTNGTLSIFYSF
jgi:hypothetical protein